jgi:hypothetical protein
VEPQTDSNDFPAKGNEFNQAILPLENYAGKILRITFQAPRRFHAE